ncbi:unnamed protein product [Rhodiola kirilowii]
MYIVMKTPKHTFFQSTHTDGLGHLGIYEVSPPSLSSLERRQHGTAPASPLQGKKRLRRCRERNVITMDVATSAFLHSNVTFLRVGRKSPSLAHFHKQLAGRHHGIPNLVLSPTTTQLNASCEKPRFSVSYKRLSPAPHPLRSSFSDAADTDTSEKVGTFCIESLKGTLLELTPFDACKWAGILSIAIAATKWVVGMLFNPFFWMYFSWTWMFWPSLGAIAIGIYGLYCLSKHYVGKANIFEQLVIVTSTITWLTLVPPGFVNGFLEGWPFVFFLVYHYFFFLNVTVRKRQYGDYYARAHDVKWDVRLPAWRQFLFCGAVMVGHWLAAYEAPELHLIPSGWWINTGIWILLMVVIFTHYYATVFLAKYVDNTAEPTAVVQFGPYRSVRHPIYASTMLLFLSYFVALRAPLSMLYVTAVCLLYYGHKAKVEEELMLETFGDRYTEYQNKVKFKFIPCIY